VSSPAPYVGLAVHVLVCIGLAVGLLGAAAILRHRARSGRAERTATYECGEVPFGPAWKRVGAGFYLVALVFILFDIEAAFLFLWVQSLRDAGAVAFWAMLMFLGVLLLGWAYAWRKGDLSWSR